MRDSAADKARILQLENRVTSTTKAHKLTRNEKSRLEKTEKSLRAALKLAKSTHSTATSRLKKELDGVRKQLRDASTKSASSQRTMNSEIARLKALNKQLKKDGEEDDENIRKLRAERSTAIAAQKVLEVKLQKLKATKLRDAGSGDSSKIKELKAERALAIRKIKDATAQIKTMTAKVNKLGRARTPVKGT